MRHKNRIAFAIVATAALLLLSQNAGATSQCSGSIDVLGVTPDDGVAIILIPDVPCGCLNNRLVLRTTTNQTPAPNRKGVLAAALAAMATGKRVSLLSDFDPAAGNCFNCGDCIFYDISIFH